MKLKAVMYGAGNIGRGFIGALFAQSGYEVSFIDINEDIVNRLHEERHYPIRVLLGDGYEDIGISDVDALNGNDTQAVAYAIAQADIMATAVGAKYLKHIAPNIANGLRMRFSQNINKPLNILICENLMDADSILKKLIEDCLNEHERTLLNERVGFVETSIGRMVPIQTASMQEGNPLRVCVEEYGFLPVDKDAFKGEIPNVNNMIPFSPFGFYIKRKLYIHNMGHAVCAYMGLYTGLEYIHEAMSDPWIRIIIKEAMCESMSALSYEYGVPMQEIMRHADDLLIRFSNKALGDTCARVSADPARKLNHSDRLIGAASLCEKHGILPVYIAIGAAGALHRYLKDTDTPQGTQAAKTALLEITRVDPSTDLGELIVEFYSMLIGGANPAKLCKSAEEKKKWMLSGTI